MLKKIEIDREFSRIYPELLNISEGIAVKYGRGYDPRMMVNEAYLYIFKKWGLIDDLKKVRIYSIKFIRDSIIWENSEISIHGEGGKMTRKKAAPLSKERIKQLEVLQYFDAEAELDLKIALHEREVNFKVLKSHYYAEVKDPVKKRVFEVYVLEGADSKAKLAAKFNIHESSAFRTIKEFKEDFKAFAERHGYIEKS